MIEYRIKAEQAMQKLIEGNNKYVNSCGGCFTQQRRTDTLQNGQHPIAIIISCSDSRVVPEAIFSADIGDLFVIRIAGNVVDDHQLGSIEYAAEHLGCGLLVVLGHNHCGAVDAAINHEPSGYIKFITDEISKAIGDEKDEYKACCLNALHSKQIIESSLEIQRDEREYGLRVVTALYHLESGKVEFLDKI